MRRPVLLFCAYGFHLASTLLMHSPPIPAPHEKHLHRGAAWSITASRLCVKTEPTLSTSTAARHSREAPPGSPGFTQVRWFRWCRWSRTVQCMFYVGWGSGLLVYIGGQKTPHGPSLEPFSLIEWMLTTSLCSCPQEAGDGNCHRSDVS